MGAPPQPRRRRLKRAALGAALALGLMAGVARADYPPGPQLAKDGTAVVLQDYATVPLSSRTTTTYPPPIDYSGQLARVNFLRSEPGNTSRFFVVDNNRELYILDKSSKTFTPYINFEDVFPKFDDDPGYAGGLVTIAFDPNYATNGRFYTVHTENPADAGSAVPTNAHLPGFDPTGYTTTPPVNPPAGTVVREAVLVEWTDTNPGDTTFEGTARELLRIGFTSSVHPMGDMTFDPNAKPGDPDYGNLYIAVGDGAAGEQSDAQHTIPQRLDTLLGKVLRITPDVTLRPQDELSPNGRYRIPTTGADPNPFVSLTLSGLRKEIYAYGFRNPHRLTWDPVSNRLILDDVGLNSWEEVDIVHEGGNYGYAEREGDEQLFVGGTNDGLTGSQTKPPTPFPSPDTLTVNGLPAPVTPIYPVAEYSHRDGDAISSGFVYRGSLLPQLDGKYVFGDISTGRLFYADLGDMIAADDGNRTTLAAVHELQVVYDSPYDSPDQGQMQRRLFDVVADAYHRRGGTAPVLPGGATVTSGNDPDGVPYGGGRADIRLAQGGDGELYVLSKSDGMIRKLVAVAPALPAVTVAATDPTATEAGPTTGTFTVTRTGSTAAALTVKYTVGGSATAGTDYAALPGSVTIPAGASSATVTVTPIDDTTVEPDETVVLWPAPDPAYFVESPGNTATVTIASDDSGTPVAAALYPFSEGAGTTTADVSGNGNNGAITAATWTAGKFGEGLQFNGSSAYVSVPDSPSLDLGGNGTIEAWVKLNALGVWHGIVAKGSANSVSAHNYAMEVDASNKVECSVGNGTGSTLVLSASTLASGTLYHLACVWNGTQVQVYVNGALSASGVQTVTPAGNTAPLSIGQYGGNADRANALIDEVRVYASALTQAQVQSDMGTPIAQPPPDTVSPTATITAPANGATVSGTVNVTANASDNVGVAGVQFKLDGANLGAEDTTAPYSVSWSTTTATNGSHVLTAVARDAAGNSGTSASVTVTTANDKTPPSTPTNLKATASSSSQVDLTWTASTDDVGVTGYRITRNGAVAATVTGTSWSDTGLAASTTYTYTVAAVDAAGNVSAASAPASATTPASSGPSAAYRFNEGSGTTTADASGHGNTGTLLNGAAWTTGGKYGDAISFDGVDDAVSVASSPSLALGRTGTIEAWVEASTLNRWNGVVAKGSANSNPGQNYALELTNANRWFCIVGNGTAAVSVQSTSGPQANQFNHVACTWNGTSLQLYVNGTLNASAAQSITPASNSAPLSIGQFGGNSDRFKGVIDEVRIYGRALSQSEIQADMSTPV